jgi:hypothetical protein
MNVEPKLVNFHDLRKGLFLPLINLCENLGIKLGKQRG